MEISAKDIAGILRTLSKTANQPHFTSAVIAAAGSGTRMDAASTKQLMTLAGMPVIVRTMKAFEDCPLIDEIVVAAREDEKKLYHTFAEEYHLTKLKRVVSGGATRQESVLNAFEAVSDTADFIAIHDGARCLVTPEIIETVVNEAYRKGAASAACRVSDTVKRTDPNRYVAETLNRDELWLAQTPQAFDRNLYRVAAYVAKEEGFAATDDNSLAEHVGFPVRLIDCGTENMKITTPTDLIIAEALIRAAEEKKAAED